MSLILTGVLYKLLSLLFILLLWLAFWKVLNLIVQGGEALISCCCLLFACLTGASLYRGLLLLTSFVATLWFACDINICLWICVNSIKFKHQTKDIRQDMGTYQGRNVDCWQPLNQRQCQWFFFFIAFK